MKSFFSFFCIFFVFVFSFRGTVFAQDKKEIIVIAADEWCPVSCNEKSARPGIGVELVRKVFEPLGYKVSYVVMPWARALEEVRHGRIDAVVGANETDDPSLVFPRNPILYITDDFYVRQDSTLEFSGIESFRDKRLGVIRDYGYDPVVKDFIASQQARPDAVQSVAGETALQQNIKKLMAGRIDALVESGVVMEYTLQTLGMQGKLKKIGSLPQGYVYVGFSPVLKQSASRAKLFDSGVDALRLRGEIKPVYAIYGISYEAP